MGRKGVAKILLFGFVLVILLSGFASAGFGDWFKGLFEKDVKLAPGSEYEKPMPDTFKTVYGSNYMRNYTCNDADGGIYPYTKTATSKKMKLVYNATRESYDLTESYDMDYCYNSITLREFYCKANGTSAYVPLRCENGCENGVCKSPALLLNNINSFQDQTPFISFSGLCYNDLNNNWVCNDPSTFYVNKGVIIHGASYFSDSISSNNFIIFNFSSPYRKVGVKAYSSLSNPFTIKAYSSSGSVYTFQIPENSRYSFLGVESRNQDIVKLEIIQDPAFSQHRFEITQLYLDPNICKACKDDDINSNPLFTFSKVNSTSGRWDGAVCSNDPGNGMNVGNVVTDFCANSTTLSEASCSIIGDSAYKNHSCQYGCIAGRCNEASINPSEFVFETDPTSSKSIRIRNLKMNTSIDNINILYGDGQNFTGFGRDNNKRLVYAPWNYYSYPSAQLNFDLDTDAYFIASDMLVNNTYLMKADNFVTESNVNYTSLYYRENGIWKTLKSHAQQGESAFIGYVNIVIEQINKAEKSVRLNLTGSYGSSEVIYNVNKNYFNLNLFNSIKFPRSTYDIYVDNSTGYSPGVVRHYQAFWENGQARIRC